MTLDASYLPKVYRKQGGDEMVIADGGKITVESGGSIVAESGAIMTLPDISLEVGDLALASAKMIVGNVSGKAAAVDLSGDATLANTGAITIAAKAVSLAKMADMATASVIYRKTAAAGVPEVQLLSTLKTDLALSGADLSDASITSAKLAAGAGVAALLTAGLGGSASVTKTSAATTTIIAANATKARACLVLVVVDETYAVGTGTLPTVKIGEDDTVDKCMVDTVLDTEAAGTVLAFAFTNLATKKIIVTTTAAVGNATGGCSITVLAIPTT